MKRAHIVAFCFFFFTTCVQAEQIASRIVHFPKDKALGRLMIRDVDPNQRSAFMSGWELMDQAQGDVTVPTGKQLRLEVYRDVTDISFISELKPSDLESLSLSGTNIIDEDFVHLKDLVGLLALDLSSMQQIDGSGLVHLSNFKSLKELTCFNANIADTALEHISKIASLERLTLYMTQVDGSGLIHLKNLTSLKNLSLSKTSITDASLAHLKEMSWLEELELYDTEVGDDGLAYLKGLTSLTRLILGSIDRDSGISPITDAGLAHLSKLTRLKNLGLYRTCITDGGLKHLSGLANLETLSLNKTQITGEGFEFLNRLCPLTGLELDEIALTGAGLANLKPWSNTLENLDLTGIKLNDADLAHLRGFKALKYINLRNTPITDAGLVHIKDIMSLETLYFNGTNITDEGLMVLKDLQNLERINVTDTLVTNIGLENFKQASASRSIEANISFRLRSSEKKGLQIVKAVTPQPEAQALPLIGKPIPGFDEIKIDIDWEQTRGKMMLICFWDMEQRPSRNYIIHLSKKAQELKSKNTVVAAIQASKIDESALNEWVRKHNIPCPVGIVRGDEAEIRFAWGVRSLPWLVLTDKQHIIRAEGFGVDELDAKIEEIVPSANDAVNTSKVTGLVKDPQGQALSNVRVTELRTDQECITDSEGKFVSACVPSDNTRYFFAVHKQRKLVGAGRLPAGERHVEINLVPAKMVSGTVVDPDGKPVAGAQVAPLPMTNSHVLTNRNGQFDVGWDPKWAGPLKEFFLMARHLERDLAGGIEINEDTENVRIKLEPALRLAGVVQDPNGVLIPGAKVGLSLRRGWACGTPVEDLITDAQGRYEFRTLPQMQEYINWANAEGYWQNGIKTGIINRITDREEVGPIILKKPNLSVSGVVVDSAGKPVASCKVGVRGEGQPQRTTETGAQGKFTLEKICSGRVEIWAKLDSVLYGTVEVQAGQKNIRLVVSPIE